MKLYTVLSDGKELVAAEAANGQLIAVEALGVNAADMNALIDRWEELGSVLAEKLAKVSADEKALKDYKVLAPIPRPKQDVVCLGVNYFDHMKEAAAGIDFVKKAGPRRRTTAT